MEVNPKFKYFGCAKRGCDRVNPDYLAFESGFPNNIRHWCLNHVPMRIRLFMFLEDL